MNKIIVPYKMSSKSAADLARSIGAVRVRDCSKLIRKHDRTVLNWGLSDHDSFFGVGKIINRPNAVHNACNKIQTYDLLSYYDVPTVEYTMDIGLAREWIKEGPLLARTKLSSHSGSGVTYLSTDHPVNEVIDSEVVKFWTKYIGKSREFRVHCAKINGVISPFFIQEKKKRSGMEADKRVRSYDNGWVFCHLDLEPIPSGVEQSCCRAVSALGLDFGAVDVIYSKRRDAHFVLEVNTAPGLDGTTLTKYSEVVNQMMA